MTAIESRWLGAEKDQSGSLLDRVMAAREYPMDPRGRELLNAPRANLLHQARTLPGATAVAVQFTDNLYHSMYARRRQTVHDLLTE